MNWKFQIQHIIERVCAKTYEFARINFLFWKLRKISLKWIFVSRCRIFIFIIISPYLPQQFQATFWNRSPELSSCSMGCVCRYGFVRNQYLQNVATEVMKLADFQLGILFVAHVWKDAFAKTVSSEVWLQAQICYLRYISFWTL